MFTNCSILTGFVICYLFTVFIIAPILPGLIVVGGSVTIVVTSGVVGSGVPTTCVFCTLCDSECNLTYSK